MSIYLQQKTIKCFIYEQNNLERRVYEHKNKLIKGYTATYNITKLVYYEEGGSIKDAIQREKQLKGRKRQKKIDLIRTMNPDFKELYPSTSFHSAQDDKQ